MSKARIPGPRKQHWIWSEVSRAWFDVVGAAAGGVFLILKAVESDAVKAGQAANKNGYKSLAFAAAAVGLGFVLVNGVLKIVSSHRKDREASDRSNPMHLLAPLRVLYALVKKKKKIGDDLKSKLLFRVTLHRHLPETDEHDQCVPYVGGKPTEAKKIVGRKWPNSCGIVGRAIRSKYELKHVPLGPHVDNLDKYVAELIDLYGYSEDQARLLQGMRLSALAIPILSEDEVIGVVYCDSSERDFFDTETIDLCVQISAALTEHIGKTYV